MTVQDFHGNIRGFELTSLEGDNYQLVQTVSRKQLTRSLGTLKPSCITHTLYKTYLAKLTTNRFGIAALIEPLSEEAKHALLLNIGEPDSKSTRSHRNVID